MLPFTLLLFRPQTYKPNTGRRRGGVLRVAGFFLAVLLVFGAFRVSSARAEFAESSLAFGRELSQITDVTSETHVLDLNGQRLGIASGVATQSIAVVLDRIEAGCKESPGPLAEVMTTHPGGVPSNATHAPPSLFGGVFRTKSDDDREGVVLCF